jgi:hypothetical protein
VTTSEGSEELHVLADDLVAELGALQSHLAARSDTWYDQHTEFSNRGGEFGSYIESAVVLSDRRRFAQAFALLRSALDQWAADLVALLGERYVQLYDNATDDVLADAVDRWQRGKLPSVVEEPRLVGKKSSKLRIVRRGLTADESMVLHPIYFEAANFDPFYGLPDEQAEFADWFDLSLSRDHATEQRQRYNAIFKWGPLVESLLLNDVVDECHRLHINVHHRFLSAFVHSHHSAHRLLASPPPYFGPGPAEPHAIEELVLLYAVQLSARSLAAFVKMTRRPPRVGLTKRDRIEELVSRGLDRAAHLWFLTDEPHLYDRGQELLTRIAESGEFRARPGAVAEAMAIPASEVRYYRNPLDRLRKMHKNANDMATGFNDVSPWA